MGLLIRSIFKIMMMMMMMVIITIIIIRMGSGELCNVLHGHWFVSFVPFNT